MRGPAFAEDPINVPVMVAVDLLGVQRLIVLVDRNPIRKVLDLQPITALPAVSFRFKLEQTSPVRALAQAADAPWRKPPTGSGMSAALGSIRPVAAARSRAGQGQTAVGPRRWAR